MSYKPEESKLIAYLYDELSDAERKEVEVYLSGNPEAVRDLEALKETRSALSSLKDEEVDVPNFTFNSSPTIVVGNERLLATLWKKSLAVAASIVLVLFIGYLTEFHMTIGKEGFKIAFADDVKGYNQEEVESLIASAIEKNNRSVNQELLSAEASLKHLLDENLEEMEVTLAGQKGPADLDQKLLDQRQEFLELFKHMIETSELEQQKYMKDALVDFAFYLDVQRQDDLEAIQTKLNTLEDNDELNRFQANRILSNLLPETEESNHY